MKQNKILAISVVVGMVSSFILGVYSGIYKHDVLTKIPIFKTQSELRLGGFKYINPILDYETPGDELKTFQTEVEVAVDQIKKDNQANEIAIYFRDLNNGPWYGVNIGARFTPASLLKVPVMMSYYSKAQSDPEILKKNLTYHRDPQSSEDTSMKDGDGYSVDHLIEIMIIDSDNEAKKLLTFDSSIDFQKPYTDLGVSIPLVKGLDDNMTVKQYASFFRVLYNASYLNKEMSSKALELLTKTKFNDALRAGVPGKVEIAHKFGERILPDGIQQLHDCGIVYQPKHPYLICIMTRGKEIGTLKNVLKDLSALVYRKVDEQK